MKQSFSFFMLYAVCIVVLITIPTVFTFAQSNLDIGTWFFEDFEDYYEYDEYDEYDPVPEITAISVFPDDEEEPWAALSISTPIAEPPNETIPVREPAPPAQPRVPPPIIRVYVPETPPEHEARVLTEAGPSSVQPKPNTQVFISRVVVTVDGKEYFTHEHTLEVPFPAATPVTTVVSPVFTPGTNQPPVVTHVQPPAVTHVQPPAVAHVQPPASKSVQTPVPAAINSAKIIPRLPDPSSMKVYRVQVGAFSRTVLAQEFFNRLKSAGFSPAFEQHGSLFRVVIPGIKASDMSSIAWRLGAAGFNEAWIREEN
jgi:cell division protein FtsN